MNNPSLTTDRFGSSGNAYLFASAMSQAVRSTSNLGVTGAVPRAFSFWMKTNSTAPFASTGVILSIGAGGLANLFGAYVNSSNPSNIYGWGSGALPPDFYTGLNITGVWDHWVFTYDGSNFLAYCNGVATPGSSVYTLATIDSQLVVGASSVMSYYFDGSIDDVRVYTANLLAAEIAALYSITKP